MDALGFCRCYNLPFINPFAQIAFDHRRPVIRRGFGLAAFFILRFP
jgi:hypothetical protein